MIDKTINVDLDAATASATSVNNIFTGVDDQVNLFLDPFVNGFAFIYWVDLPEWFDRDQDLKHFKHLSQVNFRSFQGVSSIELNTAQLQTGFAGHEINVVTGVNRNNTEFQIGHKEYSGGVMRKMYQKWISLIRDPRTGIATYPKLYGVDYGAKHHSGSLLYCVVRPDVTNTSKHIVEYAAFYSNVVPTNVPLDSLYNYELGSQDSPTIEISFKGFPEIGPNVDLFAEKILREKIMNVDSSDHIPFVDSYNTDKEHTEAMDWTNNTLKEIFVDTEASDEE